MTSRKQKINFRRIVALKTNTKQHFVQNETIVENRRLSKQKYALLRWVDKYAKANERTSWKISKDMNHEFKIVAQNMYDNYEI